MSTRRGQSPPPMRSAGSARGSARGGGSTRRRKAQTSDDEDDRVIQQQVNVRRKIRRVIDRLSHTNLIGSVEYLASAELNHVESSMALTHILDLVLNVATQYEEIIRDQVVELEELRAKVIELEKDSDERTVILDDDRGRVFAPALTSRGESGGGNSARGSARGTFPPRSSANSFRSPPPPFPASPVVRVEPAPPPFAMMTTPLPQPGMLPYPVGTRLPERGPPKQYTILILHYLASAVPMDAVIQWCRNEETLLKEWVVGLDEGRGEVVALVKYAGRKMAIGTFTFRIGTDHPSVGAVPPPRNHEDAIKYVQGLTRGGSWGNDDDISEGEEREL